MSRKFALLASIALFTLLLAGSASALTVTKASGDCYDPVGDKVATATYTQSKDGNKARFVLSRIVGIPESFQLLEDYPPNPEPGCGYLPLPGSQSASGRTITFSNIMNVFSGLYLARFTFTVSGEKFTTGQFSLSG